MLANNIGGEEAPIASDDSHTALCRFGVNANEDPGSVDLASLRVGWYMNFSAATNPSRPGGIEYMPVIRLQSSNVSPEGYTYNPSGAELQNVIATNPGAKWMIGNEPDRRDWQDDMLPEAYARAYHELYHLIKEADPTAQILAGSIVQATPVRLLYLDMVLNSYHEQFGQPLPVDGWSIHGYILPEVSCDYDPTNCWGAEIPPGVDWNVGEVWGLQDMVRVDIFVDRILRFRQWMAQRGYRNQPLYVTEYGVLPQADLIGDEDGELVKAFMSGTYDYMLSATDPNWGNPSDGFRLVQQWSWYSITDNVYFNGNLFEPDTYERTKFGDHFASYTTDIEDEVDFYPHHIGAAPPVPLSQGEPVTLTLRATIANAGNLVEPTTATVRFYDAHPDDGGIPIGSDQIVSLTGCGDHQDVNVQWTNVLPGAHDVYVQVTSPETETITGNNLGSGHALVSTHRNVLPRVSRALSLPGE